EYRERQEREGGDLRKIFGAVHGSASRMGARSNMGPQRRRAGDSRHRRLGNLLQETPRRAVPPGEVQRLTNGARLCRPQPDIRRAPPAPRTFDRREHARLRLDEQLLLLGRQLDHAPAVPGIAERREDFPRDTKVRVAHVRGLGCLRHAQGEASKLVSGHAVGPQLGRYTPHPPRKTSELSPTVSRAPPAPPRPSARSRPPTPAPRAPADRSAPRRTSSPPPGPPCRERRSRAPGSVGSGAPRSHSAPSATPALHRRHWCAATGCRLTPPRAPESPLAPRCSWAAAP